MKEEDILALEQVLIDEKVRCRLCDLDIDELKMVYNSKNKSLFSVIEKLEGFAEEIEAAYTTGRLTVEFVNKRPQLKNHTFFKGDYEKALLIMNWFDENKKFIIPDEMIAFGIEKNYEKQACLASPACLISDVLQYLSPESQAKMFFHFLICMPTFMRYLSETDENTFLSIIAPYYLGEFPSWLSPKSMMSYMFKEMEERDESFYSMPFYFLLQTNTMQEYISKNSELFSEKDKEKLAGISKQCKDQGIDQYFTAEMLPKLNAAFQLINQRKDS